MHVHGGYGEVLVNGTESLCDPISSSGDGAARGKLGLANIKRTLFNDERELSALS